MVGEKPICGIADFISESHSDFEFRPAELLILVVVEPHVFSEMLRIRITDPGTASLYLRIAGLEFGWEPDSTHQIWKLDDDSDCGLPTRRHVTGFSLSFDTFQTTERAIMEARDGRIHAEMAHSRDPEVRKIGLDLQRPKTTDLILDGLRRCQMILMVILVIIAFLALKLW